MTAPALIAGVTSAEIVAATGLTYRQVDNWTSHGYLCCHWPSPGVGSKRLYPSEEIEVARAMQLLTEVGLSPEAAHKAAHSDGWLHPRVRVVIQAEQTTAPRPA